MNEAYAAARCDSYGVELEHSSATAMTDNYELSAV